MKSNLESIEDSFGDLRLKADVSGGFVMVTIYDADDHDTIIISEDHIKPLRDYLNRVLENYSDIM